MMILARTSSGAPLFVRDNSGRDFEVEARELHGAGRRPRATNAWPTTTRLPGWSAIDTLDTALVVAPPARQLYIAHALTSLEETAACERRARAMRRLGGDVEDSPTVLRRRAAIWALPPRILFRNITAAKAETANERRARALKRLQDPPTPDPADIERDIRCLLDGLRSRAVL